MQIHFPSQSFQSIHPSFLYFKLTHNGGGTEISFSYLEFAEAVLLVIEMFLSDFNSQEVTILRNSRAQMLPFRDRSGRRVMVSVGDLNLHLPLKVRWKIVMYFYWQSSSDIVSQRRGIVIALWPFDEDGGGEHWKKSIKPGFKESSEYQQKNNAGMPVRVSSLQMYYKDTPFFHALSALYVFYGLTPERRAVYRAHYGK